MADGSKKAIETVVLEDQVLAFNGFEKLEPRSVIDLIVGHKKPVLEIDNVKMTREHPFLTPNGTSKGTFTTAGDLSVGDIIIREDGTEHSIESIKDVDGLHTVYNFTVEGLHTYVAAGYRVHNKRAQGVNQGNIGRDSTGNYSFSPAPTPPPSPPPTYGCFIAGTLVSMADGSQKTIETLELQDQVLAFKGFEELQSRPVIKLLVHEDKEIIDVDGIITTREHRFFVPNGTSEGTFTPIGDLSVGDVIIREDGTEHTISSIKAIDGLHTVYNFTVEELHTYIAGGYRVHNRKD